MRNIKIQTGLISFSCTKMDAYLFISDHLLSSLRIYAPYCLVLRISLLSVCVPSHCMLIQCNYLCAVTSNSLSEGNDIHFVPNKWFMGCLQTGDS